MADLSPAGALAISTQQVKDGVEILEKYCRVKYGADVSDRLQTTATSLLADDLTGSLDKTDEGQTTTTFRQRLAAMRPCFSAAKERVGDGGRLLALTAVVCVYALVGGAVFHAIEGPNERRHIQTANDRALARHLNYSLRFFEAARANCARDQDTEGCLQTIGTLLRAYDRQTGLSSRLRPGVWRWDDYGNSVFYAMTIFTTIGYGHMYCRTQLGRLATILYALGGIPLTLVLLHQLGQGIFERIEALWQTAIGFIRRSARRLRRRRQHITAMKKGPRTERLPSTTPLPFETAFPLPLALLIVFAYTFLCAGIFAIWEEEWDYFTGFYFFFISITTIGLGDEMTNHPRYVLGFFLFFIVGLALLSMCVSVMYARIEARYMAALHLIDMQASSPLTSHVTTSVAQAVAQQTVFGLLTTNANGGVDLPTNGSPLTGGGTMEATFMTASTDGGSGEAGPSTTGGRVETADIAGTRAPADVEEIALHHTGEIDSTHPVVSSESALLGERAECPGVYLTADQPPWANDGPHVLRGSEASGQSYLQRQPMIVPQTVLGVLMASKRTLRQQQHEQQLLTTPSQSSVDGDNGDIAPDEIVAGESVDASSGITDATL